MMAVKTKNGMFKQVRVQLKIITLTAISFALKKSDGVCRLGCSFSPLPKSDISKSETKSTGEKNRMTLPKANTASIKRPKHAILSFLFSVISSQRESEKQSIK